MSTFTKPAPGTFCWFELATTNQDAAKDFYSKLFGWQIQDISMGEGQNYTFLTQNGNAVGALYSQMPDERNMGIPPHWNTYIAAASADEAAQKAKSLGGKILAEPFDVMTVGRMAVIQDPTGAVFQAWESKNPSMNTVLGEPGAFCWSELNTKDTSAAKDFYTNLFGWAAGGDPNYTEWKNSGESIGGMMEIQKDWGDVPPSWTNYVMVNNCDETAAKATSLGGNIYMGPQDIPNMGRFAIVADPQGAVFAVYERSVK